MTSQTYQADDDQPVQEHDQAVPEEDLMEADADLAGPDADPMAAHADDENAAADPAAEVAPADPESPASTAPDYPGFTPEAGDGAEEPRTPDTSPASPSLIPAAFTRPEFVTDALPARDTASADGPWNEIQAMFVDNPHASIERAAGLVDDRVEDSSSPSGHGSIPCSLRGRPMMRNRGAAHRAAALPHLLEQPRRSPRTT
jgi:hypothetical protein